MVLAVKLKSAEEKRGIYNKYVAIVQSKAKFKAKVVICAMENGMQLSSC